MEAEDYLVRGQSWIRARNVELAIDDLEKALRLDPNHFESRMTLEQLFNLADRLSEIDQLPLINFPGKLIADPSNAQVSHTFHKRADSLELKRVDGQVYQTIVDYAFGSGNRGVSLVGHDRKGEYVEYRLSFYPADVGWDVTPGQTLKPNQNPALYQGKHISIDDARHCLECHHTSAGAVLTGMGPESLDRAIGCERCHGPGGNDVKAVTSKDFASSRNADLAIARPSQASGPAIVGLCAECHSAIKSGRKITPDDPDAVRFQGTTLTWSRCYNESGKQLDCVRCHNPHRNAETSTHWYESKCLECHSAAAANTVGVGDSERGTDSIGRTPCPVQPVSGCIACHMPRKGTPMAHLRDFTDHFIRVHRESKRETDTRATR